MVRDAEENIAASVQQVNADLQLNYLGMPTKFGIWLIPESNMKPALNNVVYNTALVFNPDGELVIFYWKMFSLLAFLSRLIWIQHAQFLLQKQFCRKIKATVTSWLR
jgi:hypothetical protein